MTRQTDRQADRQTDRERERGTQILVRLETSIIIKFL